jgi:hypothetical protein
MICQVKKDYTSIQAAPAAVGYAGNVNAQGRADATFVEPDNTTR